MEPEISIERIPATSPIPDRLVDFRADEDDRKTVECDDHVRGERGVEHRKEIAKDGTDGKQDSDNSNIF